MKVAIPHWQGRVSPVFDVAGSVLVVELGDGIERARRDVAFDVEDPRGRSARLMETGANVLVCGAISRPLEMAISTAGIEVIPQICGDVECVLAAFIDGRLRQGGFLMPGCCGRRGGRRRRHGQRGGNDNAQR
jgi:predicted Fe-Mo cluster-binding NifX family protein